MPTSTPNKLLRDFSLRLSILICKNIKAGLDIRQDSKARLWLRGWGVRMPGSLSRHCWPGSGQGCRTETQIKHTGHGEKVPQAGREK